MNIYLKGKAYIAANEIVEMLNEYMFSVSPPTPVSIGDAPVHDVTDIIYNVLESFCIEQALPLEEV
jgi:hypothetical protein